MSRVEYSVPFMNAVRCRAEGIGFVPYALISWLTPAEWSRIRLMTSAQARAILAEEARSAALTNPRKDETDGEQDEGVGPNR
jgi:hypothetical protein